MANKVPIASREDVTRPPKGWRKPMPLAVKLQVIVNQRGMAPNGDLLDAIQIGIHFDHRPPIHERVYDADRDETTPPANDIEFIVALPVPAHRKISAQDRSRMGKTERQRAKELDFRQRLHRKIPGQGRESHGTIRSRRFQKKKNDLTYGGDLAGCEHDNA